MVTKLLNMAQPDVAYFGQKDAQQTVVIKRLVRDLDIPVRIEVVPTVREPDGLALSSRNAQLRPAERELATTLFRALQRADLVTRMEGLREANATFDEAVGAGDATYAATYGRAAPTSTGSMSGRASRSACAKARAGMRWPPVPPPARRTLTALPHTQCGMRSAECGV